METTLISKIDLLNEDLKDPEFQDKIFKLYKEEFEEKINSVLTQSESEFMNNYINKMGLAIVDIYSEEAYENEFFVVMIKKIEQQIYKDFYKKSVILLKKEWDEYSKTVTIKSKVSRSSVDYKSIARLGKTPVNSIQQSETPIIYLRSFFKHCFNTDGAIHTCKGKFIPVFDENKTITHVICIKCKAAYLSNCILMHCNACESDYYSSHMSNFDKDHQIATWDKYHCGAVVNDHMRCLKCRDPFYFKLSTGMLVCINKSCKFEVDPMSVMWVCMLCQKEFCSDVKFYNPLEFRKMKIAVKNALLYKVNARPDSLPCCYKNPKNYQFFHKQDCDGILYKGDMVGRSILVCSKCKALSSLDKFTYTCPNCLKRFKQKPKLNDDKQKTESNVILQTDLNETKNKLGQRSTSTKNVKIPIAEVTDMKKSINNKEIKHHFDEKIGNKKDFVIVNPMKRSETLANNKDSARSKNVNESSNKFKISYSRYNTLDTYEEKAFTKSNTKSSFNIVKPEENRKIDSSKHGLATLKVEIELCKGARGMSSNYSTNNKQSIKNSLNKSVDLQKHIDESKSVSQLVSPFEISKKIKTIEPIEDSSDLLVNKVQSNPTQNIVEETNDKKLRTFLLEDFSIITQIGEGSFGKIYLVEDKSKNYFSMKKIIANDEFELESFEQEYELINQVKHPNILKIIAVSKKKLDKTTHGLYILMETGLKDWEKELKARISIKSQYTEKELLEILKQIVSALVFLQKNNISHRDIKPQNILLFKNNVYKLADFGEAKKLSQMETNKQLNTLRGTELYMSPLLFNAMRTNQNDIKHNSYKSDVFSVAFCLLYAATLNINCLYECRKVTDSKSVGVILNKHLNGKFSQNFIDLLYCMLEINEVNRLDFIDLERILFEH